jgi:hypothetical protein
MILYMLVDRELQEPARKVHSNGYLYGKVYTKTYNSIQDARIARASLRTNYYEIITDEVREQLKERYAIVALDTNRLDVVDE